MIGLKQSLALTKYALGLMLLQGIRIIIVIIIMHSCIVYSIIEVIFILCGFLFILLMFFSFVFSCFAYNLL